MIEEGTINVLLLEDDREDYQLVKQQLQRHGHKFALEWVETLAAAIEKLQTGSYDVILTDLALPDSIGPQTVRSLSQHGEQLPIIVLTSLDDDSIGKEIQAAGAQDYLVKEDMAGRGTGRTIVHAVRRQQALNEVNKLVTELKETESQLQEQATLLKSKNKRLEQLYRTAQEFVDNVSHDLRTPLAVIMDYTAIISEGMVGEINDEQREMLGKVGVRADDLNNMVDDLLDAGKLESGLLGAWRRGNRVEEILHRAESMLMQRALVKQVELSVECDPDLPEVYCDEEKVGRVITNLAVNAIKFAGSEGKVRLWAHFDPSNQQVVIGVTDNGPGIDEEAREQIFKRFKQEKQLDRTAGRGFGLGLNIAHKLCEINLGRLDLQSQVGEGSTFSFTLPVNDPVVIMSRWLRFNQAEHDWLRLIEVTVDDNLSATSKSEFGNFLSCQLRQNDLLFSVSPSRWLVMLSVSPSEASAWFERTEKEFNKSNRNRPLGLLPDYQATRLRDWEKHSQDEQIISDVRQTMEERTVATA